MLSLPFFGEYLALTGEKLNGVDRDGYLLACYTLLNTRLPLIIEQLGKLVTDDPSVIETTLEQYGELVHPDSSSIREGRFQTLDQCLLREYRMALQAIHRQIFGDSWDPPTLEKVSQDMVDQYFLSLSESEPDLELPTNSSEAFL
ncbi:hypothetical protein JHK87_001363 [Glycine soja]|nr:hypothetical protein JHK87_001363 [Glycine soja]